MVPQQQEQRKLDIRERKEEKYKMINTNLMTLHI